MATTGIDRRRASTQAMLAFHACVTPMLVLVCYELAYLVHKHKAVTFCGIPFERDCSSGVAVNRVERRWWLSTCLRFIVWLLGCALLVLNLLVAYHWTANRTFGVSSFYELQGDTSTHAICAILPAIALVAWALYIGIRLWNYGTNYSYMVHATCFNPWVWMLVGALALLLGYLMPSPIYALSSNAGEMIMMATIIRMFREVHHDMQQGLKFGEFIDPERAAVRKQRPLSPNSRSNSLNKSASCTTMSSGQQNGYIAVTTPKGSDLSTTFANRDGKISSQSNTSTADFSVIVASNSL